MGIKYFINSLVFILIISGCTSVVEVQYNNEIQSPINSRNVVINEIGFGPFNGLLTQLNADQNQRRLTNYLTSIINVYSYPNVPYSFDLNFRDCYGYLDPDEPIYAIIDGYLGFDASRKGCVGAAFTNKGLHYNASEDSTVGSFFIPYAVLYDSSVNFDASFVGISIQTKTNTASMAFGGGIDYDELESIFNAARSASYRSETNAFTALNNPTIINEVPEDLVGLFRASLLEGLWLIGDPDNSKLNDFRECIKSPDEEFYVYIDATWLGSGAAMEQLLLMQGYILEMVMARLMRVHILSLMMIYF